MNEQTLIDTPALERTLTFFVPGVPAPGGSKKTFIPKGGSRPVVVDAGGKRNKDWRATVVKFAYDATIDYREYRMFEGPILVSLKFIMPRPKAHYGKKGLKITAPLYHTSRPDVIKLARSTEDAMTGIVWRDDAQIAVEHLEKVYGETTGAEITIRTL
jgi:Holliday junction resolvase RusA-like endonuclease